MALVQAILGTRTFVLPIYFYYCELCSYYLKRNTMWEYRRKVSFIFHLTQAETNHRKFLDEFTHVRSQASDLALKSQSTTPGHAVTPGGTTPFFSTLAPPIYQGQNHGCSCSRSVAVCLILLPRKCSDIKFCWLELSRQQATCCRELYQQ